jgi:hypothetical protein
MDATGYATDEAATEEAGYAGYSTALEDSIAGAALTGYAGYSAAGLEEATG